MSEIAAVVVNYKTAALTVACVASFRADGVDEVVVVDSGSGDDSGERLAASDPAAVISGTRRKSSFATARCGRMGLPPGPV